MTLTNTKVINDKEQGLMLCIPKKEIETLYNEASKFENAAIRKFKACRPMSCGCNTDTHIDYANMRTWAALRHTWQDMLKYCVTKNDFKYKIGDIVIEKSTSEFFKVIGYVYNEIPTNEGVVNGYRVEYTEGCNKGSVGYFTQKSFEKEVSFEKFVGERKMFKKGDEIVCKNEPTIKFRVSGYGREKGKNIYSLYEISDEQYGHTIKMLQYVAERDCELIEKSKTLKFKKGDLLIRIDDESIILKVIDVFFNDKTNTQQYCVKLIAGDDKYTGCIMNLTYSVVEEIYKLLYRE